MEQLTNVFIEIEEAGHEINNVITVEAMFDKQEHFILTDTDMFIVKHDRIGDSIPIDNIEDIFSMTNTLTSVVFARYKGDNKELYVGYPKTAESLTEQLKQFLNID